MKSAPKDHGMDDKRQHLLLSNVTEGPVLSSVCWMKNETSPSETAVNGGDVSWSRPELFSSCSLCDTPPLYV